MAKYKYIGKDNFFVSYGDILEGDLTQWSVLVNSKTGARSEEKVFYVKNAGFKGEDMGINAIYLE